MSDQKAYPQQFSLSHDPTFRLFDILLTLKDASINYAVEIISRTEALTNYCAGKMVATCTTCVYNTPVSQCHFADSLLTSWS